MSDNTEETTKALQRLSDQITCAICHEVYTNPKLLPCLHIFCEHCLKQMAGRERDRDTIICPLCRKVSQHGVSGLQSAYFIANYIDCYQAMKVALNSRKTFCHKCIDSEAVGYCNDCKAFICELCKLVHTKWPELQEHVITKVNEIKTNLAEKTLSIPLVRKHPKKCEKHQDETLKIFCEECEIVICRDCIMEDHKTHEEKCKLVSTVVTKHKLSLEQSMVPVGNLQTILEDAIKKLDNIIQELERQQLIAADNIDQRANDELVFLNEQKNRLTTELSILVQQKMKILATQRDQLETVHTQAISCIQFFTEVLKNGTNTDILNLKRTLTERALEITKTASKLNIKPEEDPVINLSTTCSPIGQYLQGARLNTHTVCQSKCIATGNGLKTATVGEMTKVSLFTNDKTGCTCATPMEIITCELVSEIRGCLTSVVHGQVVQQDKGTYQLMYQALTRGQNYLHIKVDGVNIAGSPFTIFACNPNPLRIIKQVKYPWGLAAIDSNRIAVVEGGESSTLSIINTDGSKQYTFGGFGTRPSQLNHPRGIACTSKGTLVVADYGNHCIKHFNEQGDLLATVGTEGSTPLKFRYPFSISICPITGAIVVADQNNHRIQVLSNDLKFSHEFGSYGKDCGELSYPCGVAVNTDGSIFVADTENNRIQTFTSDGHYTRQFGQKGIGDGQLQRPTGIAIDRNTQSLLVSDTDNHRIVMFTLQGAYIGSFGSKGEIPGCFDSPGGITTDKNGTMIIADYYNHRIQLF